MHESDKAPGIELPISIVSVEPVALPERLQGDGSGPEHPTREAAQSSAVRAPMGLPAFPAPRYRAPVPLQLLRAAGQANSVDEPPGLVALGPVPSERKARDWALVLQSMAIEHSIRRSVAGWVVLVRDENYAAASQSIDRYETENRDWPPPAVRERPRHATTPTIPLLFALLATFFLVTGPAASGSIWFEQGVAVSSRIVRGEPWRAVTALTLHVDAVHVMGNAISGTVFVSVLGRRLGVGGAALTVLLAGVAGNVANAAYYLLTSGEHHSLGASTAVFGAIGLLAATQLAVDWPRFRRVRSWSEMAGPLVGGLALLGALGAGGERTDLGAHLFGFLAGLLIGVLVAFPLRRSVPAVDLMTGYQRDAVQLGGERVARGGVQALLGAVAAAIVMLAWMRAMRG